MFAEGKFGGLRMTRPLTTLIILFLCVRCLGQSAFQEITPGSSTRAQVTKVLGQPVRSNGTVSEHRPPQGIAKVEVEYRSGSDLVDRIEVYFVRPISRQALLQQFSLPQTSDKKASAGDKLIEYFAGTSMLALTYASADTSGGISNIGYYSSELFERASGIRTEVSKPVTPSVTPRGGSRESCFVGDPGMASTNRTDQFNWAQRQTPAQLQANLLDKTNRLFTCPSMSNDQLTSAFAELSVTVAHWVHNYPCFANDRGALSEDWDAHKQWASTRSSSELLGNIQWKITTALKCLVTRGAKSSLFAASSVAIAKAGS
jgi:hypothetical protein